MVLYTPSTNIQKIFKYFTAGDCKEDRLNWLQNQLFTFVINAGMSSYSQLNFP